jgi:hypothetical protein
VIKPGRRSCEIKAGETKLCSLAAEYQGYSPAGFLPGQFDIVFNDMKLSVNYLITKKNLKKSLMGYYELSSRFSSIRKPR